MLYDNAKYQDFVRAALGQRRPHGSPVVLVLGGAWSANGGGRSDFEVARVSAAEAAARRGYEVLIGGGTSVDAVDAALAHLEDALGFTAGAASTDAPCVDAMVMEGWLCNAGAAMSMPPLSRPFRAARAVMEQTRHIMLCGSAARKFGASKAGATATVDSGSLVVDDAVASAAHDSVGVIAAGDNIVCGTISRAGRRTRLGSVSTAAIVGGGVYAANEVGGAIVIGGDEPSDGAGAARLCLAQETCRLMRKGASAQEATEESLESLGRRLGARGAAVAIDAAGRIGVHCTTDRMVWAAAAGEKLSSDCCSGSAVTARVPRAAAAIGAVRASPTIVVHGGAGVWDVVTLSASEGGVAKYHDGVRDAALVGYGALVGGADALQAAIAAVVRLEDNPLFNAGRGSRYTVEHTVEMDAVVMNGVDLTAAGASCVTNVRNPILLVEAMRTEAPDSALLVADGSIDFAKARGLRMEPDDYFLSDIAEAFYQKDCLAAAAAAQASQASAVAGGNGVASPAEAKPADARPPAPTASDQTSVGRSSPSRAESLPPAAAKCNDTVGAVTIDVNGNVAVATSTGGRTFKMCGRVGDSPIVGCGGYADNEVGAVSTTGVGEFIARAVLAKDILDRMRDGMTAQAAADAAIGHAVERLGPSQMGAIVVGGGGDVGVSFNSLGMAWAMVKDGLLTYGITHDDSFEPERVVVD